MAWPHATCGLDFELAELEGPEGDPTPWGRGGLGIEARADDGGGII